MGNYQLNWTPVIPSLNQIPERIIRFNDGTTSWIGGPLLSPTTNNYLWNALLSNVAYKFRIKNTCSISGNITTNGNTYEWLEFECNPIALVVDLATNTTIKVHYEREANSGLEGGVTLPFSTDITGVEYSLYDSTNTILIAGPVLGTNVPNSYANTTTFTGLTTNTTYTVRYVLKATVNGTPIRSDNANQLGTYCTSQITIMNTQLNADILISNGAGVLPSGTNPPINIINFEGDAGMGYVQPANFNALLLDYYCADGSYPTSNGGFGPALYGPAICATPNANNNFSGTLLGDSGGGGYDIKITLDNSPGGGSGGPAGTSIYKLRIVDAQNFVHIQYVIPGITVYTFTGITDYELVSSPKICGIEIYLELV